MNMTLRDLTTEYQALMDMLNQEDPDLQAVADTLEGLSGEIEEKADNVATMVKEYTYLYEALKNEADNLTQRAKAARSRAEWLVQYLQTNMEALGKSKIETARNKLTIKKTTPSGTSVCSFTLAVDRSYSKDGNRQTDWIDCVAWRHTAEFICKYFSNGQQMAVSGSIQTRNYEDHNGNKRKAVEVNVTQVDFCGGKTDGGQKDVSQDPLPETPEEDWQPMSDDDLPF